MVSKASDDLPEPDTPVMTTNLLRGTTTSIFLRLCSRAPRMTIDSMWNDPNVKALGGCSRLPRVERRRLRVPSAQWLDGGRRELVLGAGGLGRVMDQGRLVV